MKTPSRALVLAVALCASGALACGSRRKPGTPVDQADGSVGEAGATDGPGRPMPFALGAGYNPGLAVDPAGTAYVAWVGPESGTTTLQFCRLPRGARACDVRAAIAAEGTSLSRPFVAVDGATVRVLSHRYGLPGGMSSANFLFTSTDGGRTFGAGRVVGSTPFTAAAQGPDGTVSLTTHAYHNGTAYQSVPLGDGPAAMGEAILSTTHPYSGAIGFLEGGVPVVAYANGGGDAQVRRYLGTGDRNGAASWSPAQDIGKGERMHLAGGPKGLFLLAQAPAPLNLHVRRWDGSTFAPGVALPNGTGELAQTHLVQDAGGRLHVFWPRIEADGIHLYRATSEDGQAWQHGILTSDVGFVGVRAALAADRAGLAVWGTSASTGASMVHAVPL
jgi:hypothetical protein